MRFRCPPLFALCLMVMTQGFLSSSLNAEILKVVDQDGKPVADAIVAIPASADYSPDLQTIAVMDQIDRQFSPQVLTIHKGQKVSFPNSDNIRHNVYSFSAVKPFEIKLYKGDDVEPILFDKAGISELGCNIHDDMIAHIYVAENEITFMSNADGQVDIGSDLPSEIYVWHSRLVTGTTSKLPANPINIDGELTITLELVPPVPKKKRRIGYRSKRRPGRG